MKSDWSLKVELNKASNLFSSVTSVDFQVKDIKKTTIDNQFIHETEYWRKAVYKILNYKERVKYIWKGKTWYLEIIVEIFFYFYF